MRLSGGFSPASVGLADLVDGLVGVFDDLEPVDGSGRVGQVVADALGESQAHVARHQAHAVRVAVERHEIVREPFRRGRVLARRHVGHVALRQVGDDGDAPVAPCGWSRRCRSSPRPCGPRTGAPPARNAL